MTVQNVTLMVFLLRNAFECPGSEWWACPQHTAGHHTVLDAPNELSPCSSNVGVRNSPVNPEY